MGFQRMRRRPLEHATAPQPIDRDDGFIPLGSLPITLYQQYLYGPMASVGIAGGSNGIASIQRIASGIYVMSWFPDQVGEKLIDADVAYNCSTAGFIASYQVYVGSYTAPQQGSTIYNGSTAQNAQLVIYSVANATASLSKLTDISSLAIASIRVWTRWSDADY